MFQIEEVQNSSLVNNRCVDAAQKVKTLKGVFSQQVAMDYSLATVREERDTQKEKIKKLPDYSSNPLILQGFSPTPYPSQQLLFPYTLEHEVRSGTYKSKS